MEKSSRYGGIAMFHNWHGLRYVGDNVDGLKNPLAGYNGPSGLPLPTQDCKFHDVI
jgi:hypothetical protein